jgi:hypothetical protein
MQKFDIQVIVGPAISIITPVQNWFVRLGIWPKQTGLNRLAETDWPKQTNRNRLADKDWLVKKLARAEPRAPKIIILLRVAIYLNDCLRP